MIAFSLTPWLPLGIVLLFVSGFAYLASVTHATSRLQLEVAEHQRGRIMALWSIAFLGLRPFASLADGAIASAAGVRWAGVVLSIPALVAALVVVAPRSQVRERARGGGQPHQGGVAGSPTGRYDRKRGDAPRTRAISGS